MFGAPLFSIFQVCLMVFRSLLRCRDSRRRLYGLSPTCWHQRFSVQTVFGRSQITGCPLFSLVSKEGSSILCSSWTGSLWWEWICPWMYQGSRTQFGEPPQRSCDHGRSKRSRPISLGYQTKESYISRNISERCRRRAEHYVIYIAILSLIT